MKKALFLCAAFCGAALLQGVDGIHRYDFGTPKSPLRAGYLRVTPAKGTGYVWQTAGKLKAFENEMPS